MSYTVYYKKSGASTFGDTFTLLSLACCLPLHAVIMFQA